MPTKSFSAQVDSWTRKSNLRMRAVFTTAVQDMAEHAQTPIAKGGNMPVDTSFLRNSFTGAINTEPSGPSRQGEPQGNPDEVLLVIASAELGDEIFMGWSAVYAPAMNVRYAFRDLAAQQWQAFVNRAVARAKREIP